MKKEEYLSILLLLLKDGKLWILLPYTSYLPIRYLVGSRRGANLKNISAFSLELLIELKTVLWFKICLLVEIEKFLSLLLKSSILKISKVG